MNTDYVYHIKATEVEARRVDQHNFFRLCEWIGNAYYVPPCYEHSLRRNSEKDSGNGHILNEVWKAPGFLVVKVAGDAWMRADIGCWIVRDGNGRVEILNDATFNELYTKEE